MAQLDISGPSSPQALDHALIGQHSAMAIGRASYSMLLTEAGTVIDDLIVYRLAESHYFIIANAANRTVVAQVLTQRLASFEVQLRDITLERALIAVQGPRSLQVMRAAGLSAAGCLGYYRAVETGVLGSPGLIARTGYTGENGYEVAVPASLAAELWQHLASVGQELGLVKCGLACRDTLRLEAGMPLYGHELDLETTPVEAGQGWLIRPGKGPYVGSQALAAAQPRKHLVGLAGQGRRAARSGYEVLDHDQVVGQVTSGALSPTLGYPIAMAFVHGPPPAPGQVVQVNIRGHHTPFTVVKLPFYTKEKS